MKQSTKLYMAAALLWAGVSGAQAQFVINYQNDKGVQETAIDNKLTVEKSGSSYLLNLIEINRINYISRFKTANTNEGKFDLPTEATFKANELEVVGGQEKVEVDYNGNFQTTANILTAYTPEGKVVYRSCVSMEDGEQMRQAELNATETAISLLLPMFSGIYEGMSDEAMARLKQLITELPRTTALAQAIDKSIVSNGYLNMDDIETEYAASVSEIAWLSGLKQASQARQLVRGLSSNRKVSAGDKMTAGGITVEVTGMEKATLPVQNSFIGKDYTIDGYKGTFTVKNSSRMCYSAIGIGRKMLDGRIVSKGASYEYMLPPAPVDNWLNASSTWDDIRKYTTQPQTTDGLSSQISGVTLPITTSDDAVMVLGPSMYSNLYLYNFVRTYMSMVIADIIGSADKEVTNELYNEFLTYLNSAYVDIANPEYPEEVNNMTYQQAFNNCWGNSDYTISEKIAGFFDMTFKALKGFFESGGTTIMDETPKTHALLFNTESTKKVLANYDFYLDVAKQTGENSTGMLALQEGDLSIALEGLDIVQPKPTEQDIRDEGVALYNRYIALGNGKDTGSDYTYYGVELFYKPMWLPGVTATLDTQATGWDADWQRQAINANSFEMGSGYDAAYGLISYANTVLADLQSSGLSGFDVLEGEARALRDFAYIYLAENWGRVPLRDTGQTLENLHSIPYPDSEMEVWDFIIADLKKAADLLDWQPRDGVKGRCTKGMALSYLGEAYLWAAHLQRANGQDDKASLEAAKDALQQVINSNQYSLARSYSTLWDGYEAWPDEAIWQFANEMTPAPESVWSRNDWAYMNFYCAAPICGGWGSMYNSWELYFLYEQGDKRRDASFCTAAVTSLPEEYRSVGYGNNPFMQQTINYNEYMYNTGEFAPAVWTMKHWRLQRAQWSWVYSPVHIYFKRLANVMLDYAECLFRLNGGDDAYAWLQIDALRNRAFGNDEVNFIDVLNAQYTPYYYSLSSYYWGDYQPIYTYPIPFNEKAVEVEPAKDYYTRMTNEGLTINLTGTPETLCLPFKGKAEPWQVALAQERRKEFNNEWCLRADLQRMEFMQIHMECNYPKDVHTGGTNDWHTNRFWDFDPQRMVLPVPDREMKRNKYAVQNPAYRSGE